MRNRILRITLLTFFALGIASAARAQTYKFSTLYSFQNNGKDPSGPTSLILGADGNLYGTSELGGTYNAGTVFKMTTKGVLTVLHSFNGTPECCPSSITRDVAGNLYGTTGGTVFKLTLKNGSYTFSDLYSNSPYPYLYMGSATLDSKGNLYGTAYLCTSSACVWEIPAGGTWTEFWDSGNSTDTFFSNITIDKNGSLYVGELDFASTFSAWVQEIGGNYDTYESGGGYEMPVWLRQDASGNIYALAVGYEQNTYSEVFKIDITTGNISVLYTFVGGSLPSGAFSLDSTGNIYGMAYGKNWFIFKITSRGVLTNLYAGIALLNGNVGVVMDKSGNLYGCGATGLGSVFKLAKQ